jgi:hypothetical protein
LRPAGQATPVGVRRCSWKKFFSFSTAARLALPPRDWKLAFQRRAHQT